MLTNYNVKTSILTLILAAFFCKAHAFHNVDLHIKQNGISIALGHAQFKDENLHPKTFNGLNLDVDFTHSLERSDISEYNIGLQTALLHTRYESFPTALSIMLNGNYKYLFTVAESGKLKYYVGPIADLQYGTNMYFNWDESHFYYANYLGGGVSNRVVYQLNNSKLMLHFDVPLLAVICRPTPNRQYKIDDMTFTGVVKNLASNPQLALPNKNFDVKTGIEYHFNSSKKKARSLGYNFRYHFMQARDGEPYRHVKQTLSYKFIF